MPYYTVAFESMQTQTNFHNVCAAVRPGQPLICPDSVAYTSSAYSSQLLLDSSETRVQLVRLLPHQSMKLAESSNGP
jgi:hypothetical protein